MPGSRYGLSRSAGRLPLAVCLQSGYNKGMSNRFFLRLLAAALLFAPVSGAQAVQSEWTEMKPARYRLVAAEINGRYFAALQIDLKPGWHTYWRYPGASGMAPEFDFSGGSGVNVRAPLFPAPYFFDDGVGGFYGYQGMAGFVFPVDLQRSATLRLQASFGICREVCVPVDIKLELPIKKQQLPASPHAGLIRGWLAAQPQAPSDTLRIEGVTFDGTSLQLVVTGRDLDNPQVMSVPGPHDVLGEPRVAAYHPEAFLIEVPAWSKLDHPLIGRKLTFIVRDGERAIEQDITIRDHTLLPQDDPKNTGEPK